MAYRVKNLELPDKSILEDAYLRVQKVQIANVDYEVLEPLNEDDLKVSWTCKIEANATIFVWADEKARENRAQVQHWFSFPFDYDLSVYENVFEQAYKTLATIYPEGEHQ